jgi:hypothetical protein
VVLITVLTGIYIFINLDVFDSSYLLILSTSAIVNLSLLALYSVQDERAKIKINVIIIALIMIVASTLKAFLERTIPGKVIDEFIFTLWKFEDSWPPLMKCLWHLSTDLFVLMAVVIIKKTIWSKEQKPS